MSRRILSLILALSMAFGILGANVYAADGSESFAPDVSVADTSETEPEPEQSETDKTAPVEGTGYEAEESTDEAGESAPVEEDSSAQEENVASEPEETLAVQAVASGTCGENLTWTLDDSGTLTISGTGDMEDYDYNYVSLVSPWYDSPWYENRDNIKTVIIKHGVTSIGDRAFFVCKSLTSISIPNSVTKIGYAALFWYCEKLSSVSIPDSVTRIDDFTFWNCESLTSISIPNSVTSIGHSALSGCSSLTSISIPNSVTSIGYYAFQSSGLTSISIPDSVTSIGVGAFNACSSLSGIQVESGNQIYSSLGGVLFNKAKTELICCPGGKSGCYEVPNSVTSIADDAFNGCKILTSIPIPSSVTSIGRSVFYYCKNLTDITIPNSVTSIGDSAFRSCESLTSISIPNGVTSIENYAFCDCHNLTSISVPYGMTSIGEGTFYGCWNLTSISIPNSVTTIGYAAFSYCESLTSISIPNSVTSIGDYAFAGSGLTSINIPNSVKSVGKETFINSVSLKSVTIPKSVKSIGEKAFGYRRDWNSKIEEYVIKPLPDFTLSGYLGTAAETYATKNKFKFKVLDKATLSNAKWDKGKKQVTVTWKKNVKGKGYQIQFSKKQNFSKVDRKVEVKKNKKTSVTISGIRKGTYYVRMRIVKGKRASKWSAVKKVKVG